MTKKARNKIIFVSISDVRLSLRSQTLCGNEKWKSMENFIADIFDYKEKIFNTSDWFRW